MVSATLFVSELGAGTISALQSQCPCGGKWEVGVPRTVEFGDCKEEQDKNFTFKLCNVCFTKSDTFLRGSSSVVTLLMCTRL